MDRTSRQAQLRQKLRQLRQQQDHQLAKQTIEQLGIPIDLCRWLLPKDPRASDCVAWLRESFPWQWSQVDWNHVPGSVCYSCQKDPQLAAAFDLICRHLELGNPKVTLVWFNARNPVLQMELSVVRQHALALLSYDWDTWIVQPEAGWCIEYHHEGTLCFGYGTTTDGIA